MQSPCVCLSGFGIRIIAGLKVSWEMLPSLQFWGKILRRNECAAVVVPLGGGCMVRGLHVVSGVDFIPIK